MTAEYATLDPLFRDPLRIPHTLSALAGFWKKNSDMTLDEIIETVGLSLAQDPYNLEEAAFIEYFKIDVPQEKEQAENPNILRVLASLEAYWMNYPDLRLGQIVGNVKNNKRNARVSDEELIETLSKTGAWR